MCATHIRDARGVHHVELRAVVHVIGAQDEANTHTHTHNVWSSMETWKATEEQYTDGSTQMVKMPNRMTVRQ